MYVRRIFLTDKKTVIEHPPVKCGCLLNMHVYHMKLSGEVALLKSPIFAGVLRQSSSALLSCLREVSLGTACLWRELRRPASALTLCLQLVLCVPLLLRSLFVCILSLCHFV